MWGQLPKRGRKAKAAGVNALVAANQQWHDLAIKLQATNAGCLQVLLCTSAGCQIVGTVCPGSSGPGSGTSTTSTRSGGS
jgi:hypothetical protein